MQFMNKEKKCLNKFSRFEWKYEDQLFWVGTILWGSVISRRSFWLKQDKGFAIQQLWFVSLE